MSRGNGRVFRSESDFVPLGCKPLKAARKSPPRVLVTPGSLQSNCENENRSLRPVTMPSRRSRGVIPGHADSRRGGSLVAPAA